MSGFLLSPEADEDVWNIWLYLAEETGVNVANRIEASCSGPSKCFRGRQASAIAAPISLAIRCSAVYQYLIVYQKSVPLGIVAVIRGKRDVERILSQRTLP